MNIHETEMDFEGHSGPLDQRGLVFGVQSLPFGAPAIVETIFGIEPNH
jgi:hypothetical protein